IAEDRAPDPVMLVTLDEEQVVPWAREQGIEDTSVAALARDPKVHELIQSELHRANTKDASVGQGKRFFILDHDLSQETGELTPTLKVKRNIVNEKYADAFDALYRDAGGRTPRDPRLRRPQRRDHPRGRGRLRDGPRRRAPRPPAGPRGRPG